MPLLLEADPSEAMIARYLDDGALYALLVNGKTAAVAVMARRQDGAFELKNLATDPELRGRGHASRLVRHLIQLYAARGDRLYVGTSPANVGFYQRFGFERAYVAENFFADNYPEPIVENGEVLKDMIYLKRDL